MYITVIKKKAVLRLSFGHYSRAANDVYGSGASRSPLYLYSLDSEVKEETVELQKLFSPASATGRPAGRGEEAGTGAESWASWRGSGRSGSSSG